MFKNYKEYYNNISTECNTIDRSDDKLDFYKWLMLQNSNMYSYINEASKIIDLFDISHYDNLELYDNVKIMNGPIDRKRLIEVMEKEHFIFIS